MLRTLLSDPCCLIVVIAGTGALVWVASRWVIRLFENKDSSRPATSRNERNLQA